MYQFKNNAVTSLNGAINDTVTTITVADASKLPSTFPFMATIFTSDPDTDASMEIVEVTGATGNDLTVTRGQESTSGASHSSGETLMASITAQVLEELQQKWNGYAVEAGITPSDGDQIEWDNANSRFTVVTPSGGGASARRTSMVFPFEDLTNRYDYYVNGSATLTSDRLGAKFYNPSSGDFSLLRPDILDYGSEFYERNPALGLNFRTTTASINACLWVGQSSTSTPNSYTQEHFGFYYLNGNLYATNASGSAQTKTLLGYYVNEFHTLYADMTSGTDIKFYVDGVLAATHTTNLPTLDNDGGRALQFRVAHNGASGYLYVDHTELSWEV